MLKKSDKLTRNRCSNWLNITTDLRGQFSCRRKNQGPWEAAAFFRADFVLLEFFNSWNAKGKRFAWASARLDNQIFWIGVDILDYNSSFVENSTITCC